MTSTPLNQSICVECGAPLSPRAAEGLCHRCVLEWGVHILNELDSHDLTRPVRAAVADMALEVATETDGYKRGELKTRRKNTIITLPAQVPHVACHLLRGTPRK